MLRNSILSNYIGTAWSTLMNLIFIPFYVKYIGSEAYGLIGIFAVLQTLLGFLDVGMAPTLGREMARFTAGSRSSESIRDLLRSIELIAVILALFMALSIAITSHWLATSWLKSSSLPIDEVAMSFSLMGVVTALRFIENIYRSAIIGLQKFVIFNSLNAIMATLRGFGAVVILIFVSPTIFAFFIWQAIVSLFALGALAYLTYCNIPPAKRSARFSFEEVRGIWRYAGGIIGLSLATLILTQTDKILLSRYMSLSEFGVYSIVNTISAMVGMITGPIIGVYTPKFMELTVKNETNLIAINVHKCTQAVILVLASFALPAVLYPEILLKFFFQNKVDQSSILLLRLSIISLSIHAPTLILHNLVLAFGWTRFPIIVNLFAVLFITPAMIYFIPRNGAVGAIGIYIALHLIYLLVSCLIILKRYMKNETWNWYFNDIFYPLTIAVVYSFSIKLLLPSPKSLFLQLTIVSFLSLTVAIVFVAFANQMRPYLKSILLKSH